MENESYDIGDWILAKDGRTVRIHAHDQEDLRYEDIDRRLTPEEIPDFVYSHLGVVVGFNQKNFFDNASKHCPAAMALWNSWLDKYYSITSWGFMFGNDWGELNRKIGFYDIPLSMQAGIIFLFLYENGCSYFDYNQRNIYDLNNVSFMFRAELIGIEVEIRNNKILPKMAMVIPSKQYDRNLPVPSISFEMPKELKPSGKPGLIQVWKSGYIATGEHGTAIFIGETEASNFNEACIKVCGDKLDKDRNGDYTTVLQIDYEKSTDRKVATKERYTIWACALYDNEADARKSYG